MKVYSKYIGMPLTCPYNVYIALLEVKCEKLIQGNDVSVKSLKCKKFECKCNYTWDLHVIYGCIDIGKIPKGV